VHLLEAEIASLESDGSVSFVVESVLLQSAIIISSREVYAAAM